MTQEELRLLALLENEDLINSQNPRIAAINRDQNFYDPKAAMYWEQANDPSMGLSPQEIEQYKRYMDYNTDYDMATEAAGGSVQRYMHDRYNLPESQALKPIPFPAKNMRRTRLLS